MGLLARPVQAERGSPGSSLLRVSSSISGTQGLGNVHFQLDRQLLFSFPVNLGSVQPGCGRHGVHVCVRMHTHAHTAHPPTHTFWLCSGYLRPQVCSVSLCSLLMEGLWPELTSVGICELSSPQESQVACSCPDGLCVSET